MGTRVRGWRWRRNPLRRRSDVVEAWTVLAVALLLFLGAPLAGAAAAWWAHDEAQTTAAAQRADRRHVRAEVVGPSTGDLTALQGGREYTYRATVKWTDPGDGPRTATARVPTGTRPGEAVDVWFDSRGRNVPPPPDGTVVWQHTLSIGTCAAGGAAVAVFLGHAAVRRGANRHRMAEWERDWARTEPEWTRRGV
ncbi:membrane protein [Streptomyces sp. AS58]|uniref:Integral membrane protein n=1 Tax=Streptomyces cadmiisoli TaxID=2184053 RepID=A0A2Z4J7X6_9ACTN|nr:MULTISPECIES: hypothetical protein [Streptomyces]AWW41090.1 hypothetical protein DN051_34115 [Streptomyces cadmiisoli]KOV53882.1 membrane protein [Streptomyces sp. AS58]